jgi:hypothetical protein
MLGSKLFKHSLNKAPNTYTRPLQNSLNFKQYKIVGNCYGNTYPDMRPTHSKITELYKKITDNRKNYYFPKM